MTDHELSRFSKYAGGRRWEPVTSSILARYFLSGFKIVVMIWSFWENKWTIENLMVQLLYVPF